MQHLIKLSTLYQRKVADALDGNYREGDEAASKLRMIVQNEGANFSKAIDQRGHTYKFRTTSETLAGESGEKGEWGNEFNFELRPKSKIKQARGHKNEHESEEESETTDEEHESRNIYTFIRQVYLSSRGKELPGLVNPRVLEELFAAQTTKWRSIAEQHVYKVIGSVRECLSLFFDTTVKDQDVRARIRQRINSQVEDSMLLALAELHRILVDEREGPLLTDNHYFADTLQTCRAKRVVAGLKKMGFVDGQNYVMNFKSMTAVGHLSNEASAVHDIHDALKAYYKVAMKRFVDNVKLQVIERCLFKENGPPHIFSPDWASTLSIADLHAIAGESFSTSDARTTLEDQISRLEKAKKICAGVAID